MTTLRATLVAAILVSSRLVAQAPTVDPERNWRKRRSRAVSPGSFLRFEPRGEL
jgi:hypothetical protein